MRRVIIVWIAFNVMGCNAARAQETVFALLKKDMHLADEYYRNKNFKEAMRIYARLSDKRSAMQVVPVKMARCLYFMKDYSQAVRIFQNVDDKVLSTEDKFYYAESLTVTGNYKNAIDIYRQVLEKAPGNQVVEQKIWRLNNIRYLYEDSIHYAVRPVPVNTHSGELSPVPFKKGLLFISNRKQVQVVEKIDGTLGQPFYSAYYSDVLKDTTKGITQYTRPFPFQKALFPGLQAGPMAFYQQEKKMVFASSGSQAGKQGVRTLQLYFAEEVNGQWKVTEQFPYNSKSYSITSPTISEDGTMLYFSSDMEGGIGGKDIYYSAYKNGQWSKPVNMGETVNTVYDEVFPYIHQDRILYFSSNGHPGLGGLDIFKSILVQNTPSNVENAGYPMNTSADEFGITLDSLGLRGYLVSNRKSGGYDDDIYEFEVDLQPYPLVLSGGVKLKEFNAGDSVELNPFTNARFYLVDNVRDVVVQEGSVDEKGEVTLVIPYFSQYHLRVIGSDNDEYIVSLEVSKLRQTHSKHEIVIVKDPFR